MARAGRKPSANAKRRQTTRAGQGRIAEDKGTEELCGHKRAATGRTDLPIEPLGVLYGRGKIEEAEYRAGQRLEAARRATFGHDTAAPRTIYGDRLARGVAGQWAAQQIAAADVSEETQRREARAEAEYERLLQTLHRCGDAVANATLGIATRPYAGAWIAAAAANRGRPWTARHDTRLALIREGLAAIAAIGSREL
ncbi:MAG TPA: hypothetical protein VKZ79_03465 [Alphaproteobacteria bacterium]|nr:hypothetical protein [Alphaproteobacteria bacterium]